MTYEQWLETEWWAGILEASMCERVGGAWVGGPYSVSVNGMVRPPFGTYQQENQRWSLTHLPTGYRVAAFATEADAQRVADMLVEASNGTETWEEVDPTIIGAQMKHLARPIILHVNPNWDEEREQVTKPR